MALRSLTNVPLDDDEIAEAARIRSVQVRKEAEKAIVAKELRDARLKQEQEEKAAADHIKAEADRIEWEKTKELVAQRQAAEAKKTLSGGDAVLMAIEKLAIQAAETEQHVERVKKLEKVLGPQAVSMGKRARQKSKDLTEEIAKLMEGHLEAAFKQFDTDGSGSLDAEELTAAYRQAAT